MPPTRAAARKTACGRALATQPKTASWSRKSTDMRSTLRISHFSLPRARMMAEPTIPLWPATQMRLPARSYAELRIQETPGISRILGELPHEPEILGQHLLDQGIETDLVSPAKLGCGLTRVPDQEIDFGRPEISRID